MRLRIAIIMPKDSPNPGITLFCFGFFIGGILSHMGWREKPYTCKRPIQRENGEFAVSPLDWRNAGRRNEESGERRFIPRK
jgi:hypothetical protein